MTYGSTLHIGIMNYVAYVFAFLQEIIGYLFNLDGGLFFVESGGQIELTGNFPSLTDKGLDIVGALMTIVHNGIVFAAEFSTLLPSNALAAP